MWAPCVLLVLATASSSVEVRAVSLLTALGHGAERSQVSRDSLLRHGRGGAERLSDDDATVRIWPHSSRDEKGRGAFGSSVRTSAQAAEEVPASVPARAAVAPQTTTQVSPVVATSTTTTTIAVVQQLFPSAGDGTPSGAATTASPQERWAPPSMQLPSLPPALASWKLPEVFGSLRVAGAAMLSAMVLVMMVCYLLVQLADGPRQKGGRGQVISLDVMRVLFVSYIIIVHQKSLCGPVLQKFLVGHWPMQFFTVLMGFVNFRAHSSYEQLSVAEASASLAQRLGRLCPIYFAALLWLIVLASLGRAAERPFLAWPLQALFAQSLVPLEVTWPGQPAPAWPGANYIQYGGNFVGWFAALAVFCSACFPMLYNCRPRGGLHMVVLALVSILALRSLPLLCSGSLPVLGQGPDLHVFALLRLLEYAAGMLFAQLSDALPQPAREWCGWGVVSDLSLVAVCVSVACWTQATALAGLVDGPPSGDYLLTGVFGLHALASSLSQKSKQQGSMDKLFGVSSLARFAPYSYGAFVLQVPVRYSLPASLFYSYPELMVVVHLASSWVAGVIATLLLEKPCALAVTTSLANRDAGVAAAAVALASPRKSALQTPRLTPRLP